MIISSLVFRGISILLLLIITLLKYGMKMHNF
nr:MAG TPA: hypothetical protein [Crassvirales sp.]